MKQLLREIDELLSRAKYLEAKYPSSVMAPDYWVRLGMRTGATGAS
jgi:hypothetical protein